MERTAMISALRNLGADLLATRTRLGLSAAKVSRQMGGAVTARNLLYIEAGRVPGVDVALHILAWLADVEHVEHVESTDTAA